VHSCAACASARGVLEVRDERATADSTESEYQGRYFPSTCASASCRSAIETSRRRGASVHSHPRCPACERAPASTAVRRASDPSPCEAATDCRPTTTPFGVDNSQKLDDRLLRGDRHADGGPNHPWSGAE
jgi:hypothetical protein